MGNKVTTNPQRRQNNPEDPIGVAIPISDACVFQGAAGPTQAAGLIPNNGEYAWAGGSGGCAVCSTCAPRQMESSNGTCDDSGHCGWAGTVPHYKRVSYSAPMSDCCLNSTSTIGDKTCDPKFRGGPSTQGCNTFYQEYCRQGTRIFDDPKCLTWQRTQGTAADTVLSDKCFGNEMNRAECKNWCSRNLAQCQTNFKAFCGNKNNLENVPYCKTQSLVNGFEIDDAVNAYCADHQDSPFCACVLSTAKINTEDISDPGMRAIYARPECFIKECNANGYKTYNMRNSGQCQDVNVCKNSIVVAGGSNIGLNDIKQICANNGGEAPPAGKPEEPIPEDNLLFLLLIIFIVILSTVLLVKIVKKVTKHSIKKSV